MTLDALEGLELEVKFLRHYNVWLKVTQWVRTTGVQKETPVNISRTESFIGCVRNCVPSGFASGPGNLPEYEIRTNTASEVPYNSGSPPDIVAFVPSGLPGQTGKIYSFYPPFNYQDAINDELPIGSGEIESAHGYVIQERLKSLSVSYFISLRVSS